MPVRIKERFESASLDGAVAKMFPIFAPTLQRRLQGKDSAFQAISKDLDATLARPKGVPSSRARHLDSFLSQPLIPQISFPFSSLPCDWNVSGFFLELGSDRLARRSRKDPSEIAERFL
ncbi:MAG: hypothetical protein HY447_03685 [Candidatus Omnitrophica bacterium]|nr:hypothetical protein [Candidatus Omnitrophota bacterium]